MDEETQTGLGNPEPSDSAPQELSPQSELLNEIIRSSYTRLTTWTGSFQGKPRGQMTIQSDDEWNKKVRRMPVQNRRIENLFEDDKGQGFAPSQLMSVPGIGVFPNGKNVWENKRLMDFTRENPIVEVAYLASVVDFDRRTETYFEREQVGKNIFGKPKFEEVTRERVVTGDPHTVPFNRFVSGENIPNTGEPTALFVYYLSSMAANSVKMKDGSRDYGYIYADPNGRTNNFFTVVSAMPEGVARRMQDVVAKNPLFVREVAMGLVDNKFSLTDSDYRRPNFDHMIGKGVKMYVALDMDKPISTKPHAFDPKNVVDIDSEMVKKV